jgi:hypothetical protein
VHNVSDPIDGDRKAGSLHVGPNGSVDANDPPALDVDQGAAWDFIIIIINLVFGGGMEKKDSDR